MPGGTYGYGRACDAMLMSGGSDFRPVTRACWDPAARLEDLDKAGIDVQLISATPILFQWSRPARVAADVSACFNDAALEMCASSGGRLRALCQVPLQDIDLACRELERAMDAGHVGVHIGNHVGAKDLDDEGLITFLAHCASLDAPVLVHPWDMANPDDRLSKHMMGWTVGMPLETHLSIVAMVLGGGFDRLPRSLRLCFAHGGGAFPFLLGRLENAWHERTVARGKSLHPPSHYLDRFSVDSAVFDERALRLLVDTLGAERVMLGSDYPFPLGEQHIGSLVRNCRGLSSMERKLIMGGNAADFFGLEAPLEGAPRVVEKDEELLLPRLLIRPDIGFESTPTQRRSQSSRILGEPKRFAEWLFPGPELGLTMTVAGGGMGLRQQSRHSSGTRRRSLVSRHGLRSYSSAPHHRPYSAKALSAGHSPDASWFDDGALEVNQVVLGAGLAVRNYIGGHTCDATGRATLPLADAATGRLRGDVAASSSADVDAAVAAAAGALRAGEWANATPTERAAVLMRASSLLEAEAASFALAESADTGKPLHLASVVDVPRAVANFRFFAGLMEHSTSGLVRHGGGAGRGGGLDAALNYTIRKPVGVVGLVTPWNLPLYLLTWKLAPALAMGNSVVAKPSELTPTTASMLADLMERAGLPAGVFNVVHGSGAEAGQALCSHPDVGAISFTGGTATGSAVAAAVAPRFAKLSLELGGKNALLVFADCDLDAAVEGAVRASFLNSGQICLCASRILVERTNDGFYEAFADRFAQRAAQLTVGHPLDPSSDLGPLISEAQRDKVTSHVQAALATPGVFARSGGLDDERVEGALSSNGGAGYWFSPTVLDGCEIDSPIAQQEVFGPVVSMHGFETTEEAIQMANGTNYGLAASVWTQDVSRAHMVGEALEAGTVWVNTWLHRELHMPFGGCKASGVNREGGEASLDFFSETSTICLKLGCTRPPPMPGRKAPKSTLDTLGQRRTFGTFINRGVHTGAASGARSVARGEVASTGSRQIHASSAHAAEETSVEGFVASAPKPLGAYSHARRVGDVLYLAGLGPRDPTTNTIPGGPIEELGRRTDYDAAAQTRACIANVKEVLAAHGLGLADVIDVQCFLVDMKRDFPAFNAECVSRRRCTAVQ